MENLFLEMIDSCCPQIETGKNEIAYIRFYVLITSHQIIKQRAKAFMKISIWIRQSDLSIKTI